jgi:hypothetical protein
MDSCNICQRPIEGPHLSDPAIGSHFHPACLAKRVPEEAIVAVIAALALVLVPTVVVWAG